MGISSVEEGLLTGFIIILVIIIVNIFINRNSLRYCCKNKKENVPNTNVIYYNRIEDQNIKNKQKEDQITLL
jgi:hypothetical protein